MKTVKFTLLILSALFPGFICPTNSQWVDDNSIISEFVVQAVASNNEFNFVSTLNNGIYRAPINSTSWEKISKEELDSKSITSLVVKDNIIIAGTKTYGVWRTSNNGLNWDNTLLNKSINCLLIKNDTVYAGLASKGGILISTNFGESFNNTSIIGRHGVRAMIKNDLYIFAAIEVPSILRYDGMNWHSIEYDFGNKAISSLAIYGNFVYAGTEKNGIFYSTNAGEKWYKSNFDPSIQTYSFASHSLYVFAATYQKGVCVLDKYGESIGSNFYNDPHGTSVHTLWIIDNYLFAGSMTGVKKRKLSQGPYSN